MQKTFTYQDQTIHYYESGAGTGKTVVLLHGFGEDSRIWDKQKAVLSSSYHLIIPDLPGSGLSQITNGNWQLINSIEAMADAVTALVQSITDNQVIIVGHSMGGYILLRLLENAFILKQPTALNIKAVGIINSTAFADTAEKIETRRKAIAHIEAHGSMSFLETAIPGLFGSTFKTEHPEQVAELVEKGKSFQPKALISYYEAMIKRPDRTHVLSGSEAPVLFIIGAEDKAAPMDDVLKQVTLPEFAYVHVLECGHMSMLEDPDGLNRHLVNFLKDA
jgi:pimeloyl-ACP methyl ester carboxylesterase